MSNYKVEDVDTGAMTQATDGGFSQGGNVLALNDRVSVEVIGNGIRMPDGIESDVDEEKDTRD